MVIRNGRGPGKGLWLRHNWREERRAWKNGGFSLFSVLIAISFLGILGMLLLYMSVSNFYMKVTDLKGKDSFYTAEQALEEIRTGLLEVVGDAMSKAYIQTMENYGVSEDGDLSQEEVRAADFRRLYVEKLCGTLKGEQENRYSLETLRGYLDHGNVSDKETLVVTHPAGKAPIMESDDKTGVLLKDLKVIYVDPKGRASVIQTDIRLGVPSIQFPTPSTLPDLLNTLLVADSGIVVEEGANASIKGSAYAGSAENRDSILMKTGSKLKVSNGEKVVCEGNVSLRGQSLFVSDDVDLWALGINLASAGVSLKGKTYLADDLTVEAGSGSQVTIEGEYYGYGNTASYQESRNGPTPSPTGPVREMPSSSSAIVINGKKTTLDLSGANRIMLAGKSFIAGSRVPTPVPPDDSTPAQSNPDIIMGESLTVKGAQIAYLLPPELLKAPSPVEGFKECHNPMSDDDYKESGIMEEEDISQWLDMEKKLSCWGNRSLSQIGVDEKEPVRVIFYNDAILNSVYVYFYLNFTDDSKASQFMDIYYGSDPSVKEAMDRYLSFYFPGEGSGVQMKDPDAYLRYVTDGNVLTYDSGAASGDLRKATAPQLTDKLRQEQVNYQNMWYALNRKMVNSYELLNTSVKEKNGGTHDETKPDRSVFDNLVDEGTVTAKAAAGELNFSTSEGLKALVTTGNVVLGSPDDVENLRLVICTGDVKVKNVKFRGIILAKGSITLEEEASIEGDPAGAAKVLQAFLGAGDAQVYVKDFLWDGDKYVLGNTSGDQEASGESALISNIYDLSKVVTYENWKKR
ncbi:MAG: hypothetical protein Q4D55_08820 [Eubacteriales bacterium]|nr:hypothetical protein [Eubacteriales bacterium]